MIDRNQIKELILRNYSIEDVLDMYVEKLTVQEIERLIQEDKDLESERAMVEKEDQFIIEN